MRFLAFAALCLFCVSSLGCGNSSTIDNAFVNASRENIQKACAMYSIYATLNDYSGPSSKEELVSFLESNPDAAKKMDRMSIDPTKLESYLSGRDGEPLEFRWGVKSHPRAPAYVVCWEQVGVDGKVQVGITGGTIVETDDEDELEELRKGNYDAGGSYGGYGENAE